MASLPSHSSVDFRCQHKHQSPPDGRCRSRGDGTDCRLFHSRRRRRAILVILAANDPIATPRYFDWTTISIQGLVDQYSVPSQFRCAATNPVSPDFQYLVEFDCGPDESILDSRVDSKHSTHFGWGVSTISSVGGLAVVQ